MERLRRAVIGCCLAVVCVCAALPGQEPLKTAPVPESRLELAKGFIQTAETPASRAAVVQLLRRAHGRYALRSAGAGYDLKVTFTVNSGGTTSYDGVWQMEDIFDPKLGLRWTARTDGGYAITQVFANQTLYGDGTASYIPLRLQEARAALFDPLPAMTNPANESMRTLGTVFNGIPVTCILLSHSTTTATAEGRRWDEDEECIDPRTGLLQVHSQVPGRYFAYEYVNPQSLGGSVLPSRVIVNEAGNDVTVISVDSLRADPQPDPKLFTATAEMKSGGQAIAMSGAQKISRNAGRGAIPADATVRPVCVFGLVTPAGRIVEAHSLQPDDPNSQAAVAAAQKLRFSQPSAGEGPRQQHFVFVIENFVASRSTED